MAKKTHRTKRKEDELFEPEPSGVNWKKIIFSTFLFLTGILMLLGLIGSGAVIGQFLYNDIAQKLFGYIGILLPFIIIYFSSLFYIPDRFIPEKADFLMSAIIIIGYTGLFELIIPSLDIGGIIGSNIGNGLIGLVSRIGGIIVLLVIIMIATLVLFRNSFNIIDWIKNVLDKRQSEKDIFDALEEEFAQETKPEKVSDTVFTDNEYVSEEDTSTAHEILTPESREPVSEHRVPEKTIPLMNYDDYELPPLSLLSKNAGKPSVGDIRARGNIIKQTLANFGITVEMDEVSVGPTVTRYAMKPAQGIKLTKIVGLKQDLSLALAAHPIRIEAPIPGKSLVGIEIPNVSKSSIGLGSLLEDKEYQESPHRLLTALGKGVTGKAYFANIAKMPHLLIAGTTGSGKSVTVHNLIMSLLYRNTPDELRFIMVDPKRVELTLYDGIPHLLSPVIKDPKKAVLALKWAAKEMERRYDLLEQHKCRDIKSYHENVMIPAHAESDGTDTESLPEKMPYIVCIIDELADIMQAYPRELESAIVRLAQMSRATGIHLILSTQRPSVNVITGLIKANIPSRLALQVASQIDSRTILDTPGAESLLGAGDMLYQGGDMAKPERMQAAWLPEEEIKRVVQFIKKKNPSLPDHIIMSETLDDEKTIVGVNFDDDSESDDPLYEDAKRAVMEAGKASTSYLQRKLKVGYSRAARLIDLLEENGVVGPADGSKPREVLTTGKPVHNYPQEHQQNEVEESDEQDYNEE